MARYLVLVIGLCFLSLTAVVMLAASPEYRLERSLNFLSFEEALTLLNRKFDAGDRSAALLSRRAEYQIRAGEFTAARQSYAALAEQPGSALTAQEALAQLALELGDLELASRHLAKALVLDPDPERLDRLARILQLLRRPAEERALLESIAPDKLTDRSAERLLELQIAASDHAAVERMLRARAEIDHADRPHMRTALVELLAGSDRVDEGIILAATWAGRDGDAETLARVIEHLLERGIIEHARILAETAMSHGVADAHAVIPVFARSGHGLIARQLLEDWVGTTASLDARDQASLLRYSQIMNDYTLARRVLRRNRPGRLEPDFVLGVIRGSYYRFGANVLVDFRDHLKPDILATDPLFAAEAMLALRQQPYAFRYLVAAAQAELAEWEEVSWTTLATQITPASTRMALHRTRLARNHSADLAP